MIAVLIYFFMWVLLSAIIYAHDVKVSGEGIANADMGATVLAGFFWWLILPVCFLWYVFSRSIRFVAKVIQRIIC